MGQGDAVLTSLHFSPLPSPLSRPLPPLSSPLSFPFPPAPRLPSAVVVRVELRDEIEKKVADVFVAVKTCEPMHARNS